MRTNQRRQRANEDDITYVVQLSINRCVHQFYLIVQLGLGLNIWSFVPNKDDTERNYVPDSSPVSRACSIIRACSVWDKSLLIPFQSSPVITCPKFLKLLSGSGRKVWIFHVLMGGLYLSVWGVHTGTQWSLSLPLVGSSGPTGGGLCEGVP